MTDGDFTVASQQSVISFGSYRQDGKETTSMEWLVLAEKDNKKLLVSKYALDCKPYNTERQGTTWEKCTLRKWLNNEFYNTAFSAEEQEKIQTTSVPATKNPNYATKPGNGTQDKVFLLSINEVNKYFAWGNERVCCTGDGKACWWWLRSPGCNNDYAAGVLRDGAVSCYGYDVNDGGRAVRPAMWVEF